MSFAFARFTFQASQLSHASFTFQCRALRSSQCLRLQSSSRTYASSPSRNSRKKLSATPSKRSERASELPRLTSRNATKGQPLSGTDGSAQASASAAVRITPPLPPPRNYNSAIERQLDGLIRHGNPELYRGPQSLKGLVTQSVTLSLVSFGFAGLLVWQYLNLNEDIQQWVASINLFVAGGLLTSAAWLAIAPFKQVRLLRAIKVHDGGIKIEALVKFHPMVPTKPRRMLLDAQSFQIPTEIVDYARHVTRYQQAVGEQMRVLIDGRSGFSRAWIIWKTRVHIFLHNTWLCIQMVAWRHGLKTALSDDRPIGKLNGLGTFHRSLT